MLKAGEGIGRLPADPSDWRKVPSAEGLLVERPCLLAPEGAGLPLVVEVLLRKRDRTAEAALVFRCDGSGWQVPLGVRLPSEGQWVRIRVELGQDSVRILSGDREYLEASGPRLAGTFYACPAPAALTLQVFGGAVEVGEARWRR